MSNTNPATVSLEDACAEMARIESRELSKFSFEDAAYHSATPDRLAKMMSQVEPRTLANWRSAKVVVEEMRKHGA